jgi:hypothetical protein
MPYKDPEKRRAYHPEYQRRQRANAGLTNSGQTRMRKACLCVKVPHLRLQGIAFQDGLFVTDQPEQQARIEQDQMYGREIFSWVLEP